MKVTGLERALVINFASSSLEYKRLVLNSKEIGVNPVNPRFSHAHNGHAAASDADRNGSEL